jgi:hypothetical protein
MPFGFQRKKADVLSHWFSVVDNFQCSSDEFYAEIEKELAARRVPGLAMSRVDFAEGGLLSDKRVYLRMLRERLVFDVCAAPFGRAFFFSLRFAEIPAKIAPWQLLVTTGIVGLLFYLIGRWLGPGLGSFVVLVALVAGAWVMRNAIGLGLQDLDAMAIKSPIFGPLYERFLRKETYYRHDTRMLYQNIVSEVVKKKVEEVTAAKGVKLIEIHDYNPILGDLYKPEKVNLAAAVPTVPV